MNEETEPKREANAWAKGHRKKITGPGIESRFF